MQQWTNQLFKELITEIIGGREVYAKILKPKQPELMRNDMIKDRQDKTIILFISTEKIKTWEKFARIYKSETNNYRNIVLSCFRAALLLINRETSNDNIYNLNQILNILPVTPRTHSSLIYFCLISATIYVSLQRNTRVIPYASFIFARARMHVRFRVHVVQNAGNSSLSRAIFS